MDIIEIKFKLEEIKQKFLFNKEGKLYVVQSFKTGLVKVDKGIWRKKIIEEEQVTSLVTVSAKDVDRKNDTYLSKSFVHTDPIAMDYIFFQLERDRKRFIELKEQLETMGWGMTKKEKTK
jgi:hypothetical protein